MLFTGKYGQLLSTAAHLPAKMRLNPVAVEVAVGLKITVPPTNSSGVHLLNISMLKLSFSCLSLCLQLRVVNEDPKCI